MNPQDFAACVRIAALTKAMREAVGECATDIGGDPTEGVVALLSAACFENARIAHEAAAEIAGGEAAAVDNAAVERDAQVLMGRMVEVSATYFRERFGEGGGDAFDETLAMAKRARENVEPRK